MWNQIMNIITSAVSSSVSWFESLISSLGAAPIIMAVIGMSLVVSLLLMPMRGGVSSFVSSYTKNTISKGNKSNKANKKRSG